MTKTINIKKYSNRKLYATKGSGIGKAKYVNLAQLAGYIKQGYDIKVTSNETKEDLTEKTLNEVLTVSGNLSTGELLDLIRS